MWPGVVYDEVSGGISGVDMLSETNQKRGDYFRSKPSEWPWRRRRCRIGVDSIAPSRHHFQCTVMSSSQGKCTSDESLKLPRPTEARGRGNDKRYLAAQ